MQNSIWKLVSLAGVVGICFLLVLMAQSGLQQESQQIADTGPGSPESALEGPGAGNPGTLWPESQPEAEPDPFLAGNSEPSPAFDSVFENQAEPEPDFGPVSLVEAERPAFNQLPELSAPAEPEITTEIDPFADDPTPAFDPLLAGAEPVAAPPAELPLPTIPEPESPSARELALELMAQAYGAIDEKQLTLARGKAVAASELPVSWGVLEDTPSALIVRIDAMMAAEELQNIAETSTTPDPFAGDILPVAGEEPATLLEPDPLPALATDFGPDPFAPEPATDSQPLLEEEPLTGFPSLDEPVASTDPGPEFDPFASEPDTAEATIESTPEPVISEPAALPSIAAEPEPVPESTPAAIEPVAVPTENISMAQKPEITIRKIAPSEATIGEAMIYSIEISNLGETNAAKVVVEDVIPDSCDLVGTIPQAEMIEKKLQWRLGRLPAGSEKKILVKVIPKEEGEIGSVATVNFVAEVSTRTAVRQPASPQIKLNVSSPQQAKVGENVLFKFTVANDGPADALNVSLQDIIPVGFEHPAGDDVTYEIGKLPAGQSVDVELELKAVKAGQYINRAVVRSGKEAEVETSASVKVVDDRGLTVRTPPSQPQTVGQKTSHSIRVTNESSRPVSGAAVNVILPKELHFVSASGDGVFDKAGNSIRWQLPIVEPGKTITLTTTVVPKTYGVHSSRVQLIQPEQPMEESDSLIEASGIGALHLTLENVPPQALPGDEFTIDVTVLNRGTGPDSNTQLTVLLPGEIEFVNARGPVRNLPPKVQENGNSVSFTSIPEIGERASVDFQITLRARAAGRPKIRAEVRSDQLSEPVGKEEVVAILDTTP